MSATDAALLHWSELLHAGRGRTEPEQLLIVNDYFNRLGFVDDRAQWRSDDYWATPLELLAKGGGDCEDFAIAKYYALRAMGVADERLRLTYAILGRPGRAHMVLAYYTAPGTEPLILDSIERRIRAASVRPDLAPVFAFNDATLWVGGMRQGVAGDPAGHIARLRELNQRLSAGPLLASL